MDVKTTFLYGNLEDEIYMKRLDGFLVEGKGKLCLQANKESIWFEANSKTMVQEV